MCQQDKDQQAFCGTTNTSTSEGLSLDYKIMRVFWYTGRNDEIICVLNIWASTDAILPQHESH